MTAIADIAARTRQAGKIAATLALDGVMAKRYAAMGFQLIALNFDVGYLIAGAKALIASVRS